MFFCDLGHSKLIGRPPILVFLLSLAAVAIVMVSGYLGGKMVYEDGIAVGRHRRDTPTPRTTIRAATDDGFARAASVDQLSDGKRCAPT
jgi:hypothetical protein